MSYTAKVKTVHRCMACKEVKPLNEFYLNNRTYKGTPFNYPRSRCKTCSSEEAKRQHAAHPEWLERIAKRRQEKRNSLPFDLDRARRVGLTIDQALQLYQSQNGRCAICDAPPNGRRLSLDHDHKTGRPREFLCCKCNTAVGIVENTDRLKRLQAYIQKHENISQRVN